MFYHGTSLLTKAVKLWDKDEDISGWTDIRHRFGFTFYPGLNTRNGFQGLDGLVQVLLVAYRQHQIKVQKKLHKKNMLAQFGPKN